MDSLTEQIKELMNQNKRQYGNFHYTIPSPELYPFQWLWDSCFHAFIYNAYGDHLSAEAELRSACARPLSNGLLPHIIYWQQLSDTQNWGREMRGAVIDTVWGTEGTSSITQPPLIAQAVHHTFLQTENINFLQDLYPTLHNYFEYLAQERNFDDTGLLYVINPDESGEDNSPRYDASLKLSTTHTADESLDKRITLMQQNTECAFDTRNCMRKYFAVVDVSYNAIYLEGLQYMTAIAKLLNLDSDATAYETHAQKTAHAMQTHLKSESVFLSYDILNKKHIPVLTWNIFMPLYAGILTSTEADQLITQYLQNSDYFAKPSGVPSTAQSEKSYDPETGFWRGPVWMAPQWFIYQGLLRYGYTDQAKEIKEKCIQLLETSGFREYYHPDTKEGLGAHDFTWGGLVLTMTEQKDSLETIRNW